MKAKLVIPALALLTFSGAAVLRTSIVNAQDSGTTRGPSLLIQNLVSKFGLKQDDVQSVFDSTRQQRQKEMQANFETRLADAVKNGELTEGQKQLILQKHQELLQSKPQNNADWFTLSPGERRDLADAKHEELEKWATNNNIDLKYFMGGRFNEGGRGGFGQGRGMHRQ